MDSSMWIDFVKDIVHGAKDTKHQDWKNKTESLHFKIGSIKLSILDPKKFLCLSPDLDAYKRLDQLENACYSLSRYALNLCRHNFAREEYHLLKTYTGYYTVNILSVMNGMDTEILEKMGYRVKDNCENEDEFQLQSRGAKLKELAFDLFLCQVYYRRLKEFCLEAGKKFDEAVIRRLLDRGISDIETYGIVPLCEQIQESLMKEAGRLPQPQRDPVHVRNSSQDFSAAYSTKYNPEKGGGTPSLYEDNFISIPGIPTTKRLIQDEDLKEDDLFGSPSSLNDSPKKFDAPIHEGILPSATPGYPSATPGYPSAPPPGYPSPNIYDDNWKDQNLSEIPKPYSSIGNNLIGQQKVGHDSHEHKFGSVSYAQKAAESSNPFDKVDGNPLHKKDIVSSRTGVENIGFGRKHNLDSIPPERTHLRERLQYQATSADKHEISNKSYTDKTKAPESVTNLDYDYISLSGGHGSINNKDMHTEKVTMKATEIESTATKVRVVSTPANYSSPSGAGSRPSTDSKGYPAKPGLYSD